MDTIKHIQRYELKDAVTATFLSAMTASAWGRFNDAANAKDTTISAISGTATSLVGYLFDGADSESIKLTVDVELSGSQFPFEGGTYRQPNSELAEEAFNLFKQKGQEALSEQSELFEMAEILATGKGRYSVKIKVTTRLTTTISTATSIPDR